MLNVFALLLYKMWIHFNGSILHLPKPYNMANYVPYYEKNYFVVGKHKGRYKPRPIHPKQPTFETSNSIDIFAVIPWTITSPKHFKVKQLPARLNAH